MIFEFSVNTFPFYAMTKLQTAILAPRKKITGSKIIVTTVQYQ